MNNLIEVKGMNFDAETSFPPIDKEHIQNAIMIAPFEGQMYVYGWGCYNYNNTDVWEWEPLFPLDANEGKDFINLLSNLREVLGL